MPNYSYDPKKRKRQKAQKEKDEKERQKNCSQQVLVKTPGRNKKKLKPNSTKGGAPEVDARNASESTRRRRADDVLNFVNNDLDLLRLALSIGECYS